MLTFGEKMKITNTQNLPAPVVELLKRNYYTKGASQYSVTELMSPPQIRRLREQYDNEIEIDVIDLFATQFGTFMHGKLDAKVIEGYISEERLFAEVDGISISGSNATIGGATAAEGNVITGTTAHSRLGMHAGQPPLRR
jgi:hypothetical protein